MLDVSSSSIQYEDRHELNSAADSLYSVIGILGKLQNIADRTVLLGELRGDLVTDNENTEKDLRELIDATGSHALIEIDGGVNLETGKLLVDAGADVLVAGNAVFKAPDMVDMIHQLKNL